MLSACSDGADSVSTTTSADAARIDALELQLQAAESDLDRLTHDLEALDSEYSQLELDRDRLEREQEEARSRVAALQFERDDLFGKVGLLTIELEQVRELAPLPPGSAPAVDVLHRYFEAVNAGDHATVVDLYGGDYADMIGFNPTVDPADHVALFTDACAYQYQCQLRIGRILPGRYDAPTSYDFLLELQNPEGDVFILEGCCGDDSGEIVRLFRFTVSDGGDGLKVMTPPIYVP